MPSYRLERPWFDGTRMRKRLEVVTVAEGASVPSTAVRLPDLEAEVEPELPLQPPVSTLPPAPPKPVAVAKPKT